METDLKGFLLEIGETELFRLGVICDSNRWLCEKSVTDLEILMQNRRVSRLTSNNGWWFEGGGRYYNPDGSRHFTGQNTRYNPFQRARPRPGENEGDNP